MSSPDRNEHDSLDEDGRLANRATLLTLACLCSFLLAALTMPLTFQRTERLAPRIAASTPLALGVGTAFMARAARAQLRALRDRKDSGGAGVQQGASTSLEPRSSRGEDRRNT